MFEGIEIINECKKILKKYNIEYIKEFKIFKKFGLIHCQIDDWRGPANVSGFPVVTKKKAIGLLIESCSFEYYCRLEAKNRDNLINEYPTVYGEYTPRKFIFENILNVLKDYDQAFYEDAIVKYVKYINTNRETRHKWIYNKDTGKFKTAFITSNYAVVIDKYVSNIEIYNQDPCGGRKSDNFYKFISSNTNNDILTFAFTNNGKDRFYLDIYNPQGYSEFDDYIIIGQADKIVWRNKINQEGYVKTRIRTFIYDERMLKISEDIID